MMTDKISKERRSKNMQRIRNKGMKPELMVRRMVHGMGYRYRLHRKELPGKPDLVFSSRKKIIFVHGCFWHQHDDPNCKIVRIPKSNKTYWIPKLNKNRTRDMQCHEELLALGWDVLTIWECQVKDIDRLGKRISIFLDSNPPDNQKVMDQSFTGINSIGS